MQVQKNSEGRRKIMLQGIETIFDNMEQMMHHLKKKSYEANTEVFVRDHGFYFQEMKEYVEAAGEGKEAAALELANALRMQWKKNIKTKKEKSMHEHRWI